MGRQSWAYIDVNLNERAIDENVHVERLSGAVGKCVGVKIADHRIVGELDDSRRVRTIDVDGVVRRVVIDVSVLFAASAGSYGYTSRSCAIAESDSKLHVGAALSDNHALGPIGDGIDSTLLATKSVNNVGQGTGTESIAGESSVTVLDNAGIALCGQTAICVHEVVSLDDIHLTGKSHGTLVTALEDTEAVVLLRGPTPLNTAVVLGVIKAGDGV